MPGWWRPPPAAGALILNAPSQQPQQPQVRNISSGSALGDSAVRTAQGHETTAGSVRGSVVVPADEGGVEEEDEDEEGQEGEEEEEEVMAVTRGRKERRDSVTESIVKGVWKTPIGNHSRGAKKGACAGFVSYVKCRSSKSRA